MKKYKEEVVILLIITCKSVKHSSGLQSNITQSQIQISFVVYMTTTCCCQC